MAALPIDEFPVWGLMPKKETGVVSFLTKNENYDGRDTIIAIFDSGVDPAAEGLQVTSTGETKVIQRFDCSGCGDVDTSEERTIKDGSITGLTGRKLKVPESWKNPSKSWRVGILHPFSLYPTKVKERMQEHRKEHYWDVKHKPAFAEANKELQDFETSVSGLTPPLGVEEKQLREELEARVEVLNTAEKKYNDLGPVYDCVLYHDGDMWRACIDTSESGELSTGVHLGEFSKSLEHSHLTPFDEMTVSINVHDEGNTLEVVGMCSTHGTHVAAIAAGYFPSAPERNGVAPGAKIISLTIGDSRLGSMETGTALVRACIKIMELSKTMKIDVINMSYGEHAHWSNAGRIGDIISSVVNRYGVSWVVSAGNHGPALCTVGAPPDMAQPVLIGVGAYVSPAMMSGAYSMRSRLAGGAYSWSSRGPAPDGAAGVAVCAPGGAVATVARFTLRNSQLMNGTSMAAPHVAGAIGALISGLKAKELPYSPYSMKRALENSATYLPHVEPWAQGAGLLNVERAFELLTSHHEARERDVTFGVSVGALGKGVLVRARAADPPHDLSVSLEPRFLRDHRDELDQQVQARQIEFGVRLALAAEPPAAWLHAPQYLELMNAPRALALRVDARALPPGAHYTSLNAYDIACVEKGPVFRIPVTVLQPQPLDTDQAAAPSFSETGVLFKPDTIKRHFVIVPRDATWAVIRLRTRDTDGTGRFLVHAMQLVPRRSCRTHETQKMLNLTAEAPAVLPFTVQGDVPLEVVVAKYWANLGELSVDYRVEFHGVRGDCGPRLVFPSAEGLARLDVTALRHVDVQPSAQLKYSEHTYRPAEFKLQPLSTRDVIPPGRQIYHLVNTYNFHVNKATEVSPIVPLLCDMLYESEFESQMWMIYNSNKQLMAVGDAYPSKYSVKLEKGEYVLRLNVRHENKQLLEKLHEMPVLVQQRLLQPITLDVYCSQNAALTGGKKFSSASLSRGNILPIYFAAVPVEKLGRSSVAGCTLTGTLTLAKDELGRRVESCALHYTGADAPRRPAPRDKGKPHDEYMDALKDFTTTWLPKLEGDKLEQAYEELLEKFPGYIGAHVAYLHGIDPPTDPKKLPHPNEVPDVTMAWCEQLVTVSEKVIKAIDQEKLLAYLGMKTDTRVDASKIKHDRRQLTRKMLGISGDLGWESEVIIMQWAMESATGGPSRSHCLGDEFSSSCGEVEQERMRGWAVDALCRRGVALCRMRALAAPAARDALLADNMADLLKYTDLTDSKAIHYGIWHYLTLRQWGRGARLLLKLLEERPSREAEERLAATCRELRWHHLADHTLRALPAKYPAAYRPF